MALKRKDGKVFWVAQDGGEWALNQSIIYPGRRFYYISDEAIKAVCRTIVLLAAILATAFATEAPAHIVTLLLRGSILP